MNKYIPTCAESWGGLTIPGTGGGGCDLYAGVEGVLLKPQI